jgi:hypothetical protein
MSALSTFARAVRADSSLFGRVATSTATKASPELAADIGYALDRLRELDAAIDKDRPDYKLVSASHGPGHTDNSTNPPEQAGTFLRRQAASMDGPTPRSNISMNTRPPTMAGRDLRCPAPLEPIERQGA